MGKDEKMDWDAGILEAAVFTVTQSGARKWIIPRKRDRHRLRVCAYCRVSTAKRDQEESFDLQREYYRKRIHLREDWEFAGIYADEKSGLDAGRREGFQQMIKDALAGKVDYILCKSVSRFSRNILDAQTYCELLEGNGVYCEFERDNIKTKNPSYTMMFSIMAAIAQNESQAISERTKWALRKKAERGEYGVGNRVLGYQTQNGVLLPDKNAPAVREIYEMFLRGAAFKEISSFLEQEGIVTRNGRPLSSHAIRYILQNEIYKGDRRLQKQAPRDCLTKKPIEKAYFSRYLQADHEAVVDMEVWEAVQEELKNRKERFHKIGSAGGGRAHPFYGKLYCGVCGGLMTRRTYTDYHGVKYKAWICKDRVKGGKENRCRGRIVKEEEILAMISESGEVERITVLEGRLEAEKAGR